MKHLKRFNEIDQSVIDECKDILLELNDKGIKTNVKSRFNTGISIMKNGELNNNWITFYFTRKEEFKYSDIEDVIERLKLYLSEWGLKIEWMNSIERRDQRPILQTTRVINPMNFQPEGVRTECELHFN